MALWRNLWADGTFKYVAVQSGTEQQRLRVIRFCLVDPPPSWIVPSNSPVFTRLCEGGRRGDKTRERRSKYLGHHHAVRCSLIGFFDQFRFGKPD